MDLTTVDLNLLVSLDLLLDTRSVRAAARRAHVTPSAMSHTLGRLRVLFDDELLVRAGQDMVATPRAEALVAPVREVLARIGAVLEPSPEFDPVRLRRAFRVVCTDHVSTVLLPRVVAILAAEAPGVDLHESPLVPELMEQLRTGAVDAAIGVFPDAPPEMRMRRLFTDGFVTVAREGHPRVSGGALTLEAFLAEGHMLVSPRGGPTGTIDRLLAAQGRQRRVVRTVPHFLAALWHLVETDLLLTVSRRLVEATRGRLPVQVFHTPLPVEDYTIVLAWHPRVDAAREDRWFREVVSRGAEGVG